MAISHNKIARKLIDLIDRFVENHDPIVEAMEAFENLFSSILESETPRPIWKWRNFCRAILAEMFPETDSFQPRRIPPQAHPELSVHTNEAVIPFLIDVVMEGVLFRNEEPSHQEFALKILDEVFGNELLVTIV